MSKKSAGPFVNPALTSHLVLMCRPLWCWRLPLGQLSARWHWTSGWRANDAKMFLIFQKVILITFKEIHFKIDTKSPREIFGYFYLVLLGLVWPSGLDFIFILKHLENMFQYWHTACYNGGKNIAIKCSAVFFM